MNATSGGFFQAHRLGGQWRWSSRSTSASNAYPSRMSQPNSQSSYAGIRAGPLACQARKLMPMRSSASDGLLAVAK